MGTNFEGDGKYYGVGANQNNNNVFVADGSAPPPIAPPKQLGFQIPELQNLNGAPF